MYFLQSDFLILTLIPLSLLLLSGMKKNLKVENIFSQKVLKELCFNEEFLDNSLRMKLFVVALIFLIIALARPVLELENLEQKSSNASFIIALDMSHSMQMSDVYPSRATLAKQKLFEILQRANGAKVGVLLYAKEAYEAYPLSEETQTIYTLLRKAKWSHKFATGTNLFAALEASEKMLHSSQSKNILLLSDGGSDVSRRAELKYLKKHSLKLFSIVFAQDEEKSIGKLSKNSGGKSVQFSWDDSDINTILDSINAGHKMQKSEQYKVKNYQEFFSYFLFIALVLLFIVYQPSLQLLKLSLLISVLQLFTPMDVNAGVLDFYHLHKARAYYEKKEYQNALKEYETVEKNAEIFYNLASSYYMLREYDKAIASFNKAFTKDKKYNAKVYFNIANAYVKKGKLSSAKRYFDKSLQSYLLKQTQQNLAIVIKALKKKKRLLKDEKKLVYFKNSLMPKKVQYQESSKYSIKLQDLHLSQEQKYLKLVSSHKVALFLQKISTTQRSADANHSE